MQTFETYSFKYSNLHLHKFYSATYSLLLSDLCIEFVCWLMAPILDVLELEMIQIQYRNDNTPYLASSSLPFPPICIYRRAWDVLEILSSRS